MKPSLQRLPSACSRRRELSVTECSVERRVDGEAGASCNIHNLLRVEFCDYIAALKRCKATTKTETRRRTRKRQLKTGSTLTIETEITLDEERNAVLGEASDDVLLQFLRRLSPTVNQRETGLLLSSPWTRHVRSSRGCASGSVARHNKEP